MASRKPAASIARYGQVPGVRVTNDATRRRLRYRPDTATASQRTPGHTDASTAGGPPPVEAQLRELEFRKRSGELVDRAAAERAIFERANIERDRWLGWIPRAASQIAAEAEIDPTKLFGTLDRLVRDHLTQLAATPLKVLRPDTTFHV